MESISLEVPENAARKWRQAPKDLRARAVEEVKNIFGCSSVGATADEEEAVHFFSNLSADFTGYECDRTMPTKDKAFVDSNVWIYMANDQAPGVPNTQW